MKSVTLYTDGACSNNPGKGGYAAILVYNNKEKVISGGEILTTNNRMELTAVIKGLEALKEACEVNIYSDSAYVVNAFNNNWIISWQLNGWKTSNKKDVMNKDLWTLLIELSSFHKIKFNKVKGHALDVLNNRCDAIAREEINKLQVSE